MKGFKKDGKFRPTGNKNKPAMSKADLKKWNKYLKDNPHAKVENKKFNKIITEFENKKRKKEDFDYESVIDEMDVEPNIKIIDDTEGIDFKQRRKETVRLPSKPLEDIDIGRTVLKASKILKERGDVAEDTSWTFDDHGFEGWMIDVMSDDGSNIRMSVEFYADPKGEMNDEYDDFNESDAGEIMHDRLQEQFDEEYSGRTIG